jgi:phosphohistidine phosphatase
MRLFLMRHADAVQGTKDRERPLSARGRQQAAAIGRHFHRLELAPEYVICSPARRTRDTYAVMSEFIPETGLIYPEYLYNAEAETLYEEMGRFGGTYKSALIIGHNPGLHTFARTLANFGSDRPLAALAAGFSPASVAVIDLAGDKWADIKPRGHTLRYFMTPEEVY